MGLPSLTSRGGVVPSCDCLMDRPKGVGKNTYTEQRESRSRHSKIQKRFFGRMKIHWGVVGVTEWRPCVVSQPNFCASQSRQRLKNTLTPIRSHTNFFSRSNAYAIFPPKHAKECSSISTRHGGLVRLGDCCRSQRHA